MNSAYIQFARLEYFSIRQQEDYPTDYEPANDIAYIEAIVYYWMREHGLKKYGELYKMSRCKEAKCLTMQGSPNRLCYDRARRR